MEKEFKRIFLIGYMGAGKTTLGKELAKELGYEFIDTDGQIEKQLGKTITEVFEEEGEGFFRKQEHELIKSIAKKENDFVCATGGGLPCFSGNMELMNEVGVTVYLNASVEEIANRLLIERKTRPIVAIKPKEELIAFVSQHLHTRNKYYSLSKYTLKENNINCNSILQLLG